MQEEKKEILLGLRWDVRNGRINLEDEKQHDFEWAEAVEDKIIALIHLNQTEDFREDSFMKEDYPHQLHSKELQSINVLILFSLRLPTVTWVKSLAIV